MPADTKSVGRPKKFTSLPALKNAIARYFKQCDGNPEPDDQGKMRATTPTRPYSVTGLAKALGTTRQTLCDIEVLGNYDTEFTDTIKSAKQECEIWLEENMLMGRVKPAAAIFSLKNNYGWKDESQKTIDHKVSPAGVMEKRRQAAVNGKKPLAIASNSDVVEAEIVDAD